MPDLIAKGPRAEDRWRRTLPDSGAEIVLGRISEPWSVAWDDRISRKHATMRWDGSKLVVQRLPNARNAIFYHGRKSDAFEASVGEHFVIGQTSFTILDQRVRFSPSEPQEEPGAFAEQTFSANLLRNNSYKDAGRRIEALGQLPDIIGSATSDEELCVQVVRLLMQGIEAASFVAILRLVDEQDRDNRQDTGAEQGTNEQDTVEKGTADKGTVAEHSEPGEIDIGLKLSSTDEELGKISVLHWDCRSMVGASFSPSAKLVHSALGSGESVLHVWSRTIANPTFTQSENVDWATCTPIQSDSCPGWAIYVAGDFAGRTIPFQMPVRNSSSDNEFNGEASTQGITRGMAPDEADALHDDLKFTELVATTLGSIRQVRALQRRQDSMRNFFAPVVMDALAGRDPDEVLAPRETDVSVLFCDLRGFSRRSEEAGNKLIELLQRVSDALGVMTHHILSGGGVVGDFHGDAAMGFWGWPIADGRAIEQACLSAIAIQQEFATAATQEGHPLAGFRAGLGIASGSAVAGRIGTSDQVKVTVFGPVVNLASRLEGMTKQLQASILIDEETAAAIRGARTRSSCASVVSPRFNPMV